MVELQYMVAIGVGDDDIMVRGLVVIVDVAGNETIVTMPAHNDVARQARRSDCARCATVEYHRQAGWPAANARAIRERAERRVEIREGAERPVAYDVGRARLPAVESARNTP